MWDVRNPKKPVSSFDVGLANGLIIAVRFVGHELLAMSRRRLVFITCERTYCRRGQNLKSEFSSNDNEDVYTYLCELVIPCKQIASAS